MPGAPKALVCDIQRFSLHDGPGIRTTVFFKGCSLACQWCHNPESISFRNEPVYSVAECIRCGECVDACPSNALQLAPDRVSVDYSLCTGCLKCTDACPSAARRPAAIEYDADGLLAEVMRDFDYYGDDGGVTISGGEPLAQAKFLREFLPGAKAAGLHITVETAGYWAFEALADLLGFIDLFLFDVKVVDAARHREMTGRTNNKIIENLRRLAAGGHDVRARMPLVVGRNADSANIEHTARLLQSIELGEITLLPYHPFGESKLAKIDSPIGGLGLRSPEADDIERASGIFEGYGIDVKTS